MPTKISRLLSSILIISSLLTIANTFQFNENGEFTILQLTDMHFGGNDTGDLKTQELQRNLIKWVQPDLISVSGDAVSGAAEPNPGGFEKLWKKFTEPIIEAQKPYAYILGNHDDEGDLDRLQIVALDDTNPLSIGKDCERIPQTTNFVVPIYSSRDENKLVANIWNFDSGSYFCEGFISSYGCIEGYQIDWYDKMSKKIKEEHGTDVHHLAFLHIALPEYRKMYNTQEIYGRADDAIGCPFVNTNFFEHVKANGDISAMFIGHDHNNDFGGVYEDVELVYGRKSGYNNYGTVLGARVVKLKETIDENGNVKVTRTHYIVNEDGTITENGPTRPREGPVKHECYRPGNRPYWRAYIQRLLWDLKHSLGDFVKQYM